MKKNKSAFTLFYNFILFDDATADAKKTRFLNVDQTRQSQIAVIIQASWHNHISTFKHRILLQIKNKWDVQFAKTYEQPLPTSEYDWFLEK